jgi:hypothetical protein
MHSKEVADNDSDDDSDNNGDNPEEGLPSILNIDEQWGEYTSETDDEEEDATKEDATPLRKNKKLTK